MKISMTCQSFIASPDRKADDLAGDVLEHVETRWVTIDVPGVDFRIMHLDRETVFGRTRLDAIDAVVELLADKTLHVGKQRGLAHARFPTIVVTPPEGVRPFWNSAASWVRLFHKSPPRGHSRRIDRICIGIRSNFSAAISCLIARISASRGLGSS